MLQRKMKNNKTEAVWWHWPGRESWLTLFEATKDISDPCKDHVYRMVKVQVQQYLTKPNQCIWPELTILLCQPMIIYVCSEDDVSWSQQPSTITILYMIIELDSQTYLIHSPQQWRPAILHDKGSIRTRLNNTESKELISQPVKTIDACIIVIQFQIFVCFVPTVDALLPASKNGLFCSFPFVPGFSCCGI